ncbi:ATP-binding protein [Stigmatella sp. ncwal1]|uniref:ATP-binding protein n=1 Tax=Stigmatella ashevillensis TaxID=2995309 RepID=A0ABT5DN06_9BACT|nr:ATP-binding protein [Stigmatella ashevillena]MDC0713747.1 ATP-binding protein [Stigmatella ashevillena]
MSPDELHSRLLCVLQGFMSETAARLVLRGTMEPLKLSVTTLSVMDLPRLIEALEPASRHFMHPAQRPRLTLELKELLNMPFRGLPPRTPTPPPASSTASPSFASQAVPRAGRPAVLNIHTEADASTARFTARALCEELGGKGFECQKVATAVSELARNQLAYAGGGTIQLHPERTPRRLIRVLAQDQGQGIADVSLVLSGAYRSKTGLGLGLLGVKRLADRFEVRTGPTGTQVEFEVWL